jgi:hypothetical protein
MYCVNASEMEDQFRVEAENLKNGLNTILDSGPLACVSLFGGRVQHYEGINRNDFLYKSLNRFTVEKWNALADQLNLSSVIAEDAYQHFKAHYLNYTDVKPFVKETIEKALNDAFNEPKELVVKRLTNFLIKCSTTDDFSFANSGITFKDYFSQDRTPKGYSDLKTFLIDVKKVLVELKTTALDFDLVKATNDLMYLDVIHKPKVDFFNNQIMVKSFKSGKITVKIENSIARNLDTYLGI